MKSVLAKQDNGTIQLTIVIPHAEVKKTWEDVIADMAKNANLPGFRKGKAPKKLVEEKLDKAKIQEEVLKKLLPLYYVEAVKEHSLKPIIHPQINMQKLSDPTIGSEQTDWEFTATTCEIPDVNLSTYKEAIQKVTAKGKIVIPGKEQQPAKFEDVMQALLGAVKANVPQILIDQEVERLLAHTLDDIKKLGLNLDQYLTSTGRTAESLRAEYQKKAENDIKIEFALQKIADVEKITVEEKEIDEAVQKAKDENEKKNLEANRYLLANILRQQKTLDFLKNL